MFETKCRPAVDDGNLPVNADNPLRSEPFAKLLKYKDTSSTCTVADSSTRSAWSLAAIKAQRVCLLCISDCELHCC